MNRHPTPAERLLAMLEDDGAVEALPAGEVRDGLAAFGLDPARSIAFARSLARDGDSPGGRLMGALLAGEEEDGEVARIGAADIGEVRAQVGQGAAAAIAAEARRKSGIGDNVIGLAQKRRRRRKLIVWGGPLAGIAASLLLVVVFMGNAFLSSNRMEVPDGIRARRVEAPRPVMPDPATEGYTKPGPDKSLAEELVAQGLPPKPEPVDRAKEKTAADSATAEAELRKQEESVALGAPAMSGASEEQARGSGGAADAPAIPDSFGRLADGEADQAADIGPPDSTAQSGEPAELPEIVTPPGGSSAGQASGTETAAAPPADLDAGAGLLRRVEISEIAAVLVVDTSRASLQIRSQVLPAGGLENRLEEARRLAGDRPVIALYTIATGDTRRDFAQLPLRPGLTQQFGAPSPLVGLLGVTATDYDFIALPAEAAPR